MSDDHICYVCPECQVAFVRGWQQKRPKSDWEKGYDTAVEEYEPFLRECEKTEDGLLNIILDLLLALKQYRRYNFIDQQLLAVPIERAEQRLREIQGE